MRFIEESSDKKDDIDIIAKLEWENHINFINHLALIMNENMLREAYIKHICEENEKKNEKKNGKKE